MTRLTDRVLLITGGSSGIGKAIAKAFAKEGAHVALFSQNRERGALAVEEIRAQHPAIRAEFYSVDVSKGEEVRPAVERALEEFGCIDILINNAGITRDRLLVQMSPEEWSRVLEVNVGSCYHLCRALLRPMMRARRGSIINLSSVVGLTGNAGQANYAASKAALIGFTKSLAKEYASKGIAVNCIAPGFIETDMTGRLNERQREEILKQIPLSRMGRPEEVAEAALFLACSTYITGHVLTVDGGMTMH